MRCTLLTTIVALGALACGGEKQADQTQTAGAPAGGTPAPAGPVVEVKMTGNGSTVAAFEPRTLTIAPGTTVRFINVSGGPHNVAFWGDSIPAGAAAVLTAAMANTIDNMSGPFLTQANEAYDVSFANAPTGMYKGYCVPHLALGMKIAITVQ
ncbi:MAG TPA: plastocyanin/azurin family copper-binding protein [Gemmatimonadales bacterium]|jgi:plastocyanin|nr:plastocyanin/azurin family copper-binding protein [Gemmatimonadales bacterium]